MSKIINFSDYKDKLLITTRYQEFRDLSAHLNQKIEEMKAFVDRNGLRSVKSNHRVDREVARLCLHEIDKSRLLLETLLEEIDIIESSAEVIEFKPNRKKAA